MRLSYLACVFPMACTWPATEVAAGELEYLQCMWQFCPAGSPSTCSDNICQRHRGGGSARAHSRQYGAVAITAGAIQYGSAWGYSTRARAEAAALQACAQRSGSAHDCIAATWFYDGCAAIASSDPKNRLEYGAASTAWAGSKRAAGQAALSRCVKAGGTACKVDHAFCSM